MNNIDINLYSRQLSLYGIDTMEKISELKIFLIGIRGLGIEIAKNLILSGIKSLTLFDDKECIISDMGSNFFISKNDLNKRRDEICSIKLKELNEYVEISVFNGNEILNNLDNFNIVIISEIMELDLIKEINIKCREKKIGFIYCLCLGLSGFLFSDFGDEHIIKSKYDLSKEIYCIKKISKKNGKIIFTIDWSEKIINNYDYGIFKKFEGLDELNGKVKKINFISDDEIEIDDDININIEEYKGGGIIEEYEIPEIKKYESLEKKLDQPFKDKSLIKLDKSKKNNEQLLHLSILSLHEYYKINKSLPKINDINESKKIINSVKELFEIYKKKDYKNLKKIQSIDESYIEKVSKWSKCQISPVCSFLGGIVSQESLKITGKFIPIDQWFLFDFFETVEKISNNINIENISSRYEEQIAIFGKEIQEKIEKLNLFLIGSGALGCEYLKNFALMGISCSKDNKSNVTITDNDIIEISNLNRQFLFKKKDIGKSKSKCAFEEIKKFNEDFNGEYYQLLLDENTENFFNEDFWLKQNYIFNAVDNIKARNYIDEKCCFYSIPYIDTGTLGTIGSMTIFYPYETICYRDMHLDVEKEIPMCTLKNFPYKFEHCIEWSKSKFYEIFEENINNLNLLFKLKNEFFEKFLENLNNNEKKEELIILFNFLNVYIQKDLLKLIEFNIKYYYKFFIDTINELLELYPINLKNIDDTPFWSGNKRPPKIINFDIKNEYCLMYINSISKILCKILNIEYEKNKIEEILKSIDLNLSFKNDNEIINIKEKILEKINKIENYISLIPEKFEKDNEENGHINFIYSLSVLRAKNYNIEILDIHETKSISGKIIPALSTTTSSIVGLACLQIYNLIQNNIKSLKCSNINLGVNFYENSFCEPVKYYKDIENPNNNQLPIKVLYKPLSVWDNIEIKGSFTAKEFILFFEEKYDVFIDFISCNKIYIIQPFLIEENNEEFNIKIEELYERKSKIKLDSKRRILQLKISASKDDYSVLCPSIKYIFK